MKKSLKRIIPIILSMLLALSCVCVLGGCEKKGEVEKNGDIIILFTNDVHCGIDDDIGYAGLAAYKKQMMKSSPYVTLVDCGDHLQGSYLGSVSNGECMVRIMNKVGYDFAIFGNHEFDYGMEQLQKNVGLSEATYLCCNCTYSGNGESGIKDSKPYEIVTYGKTKVGFIGVSTPRSISSSTPTYFKENGEYVYDFAGGDDGKELYKAVQDNVDICREAGADYVIVLSHLGVDTALDAHLTSIDLIANTTGIDAVLDGHSHVEIPCDILKNKEGNSVLLAQTGTKLNNIGQLIITESGLISVGYIEEYPGKDKDTEDFIESIVEKYNEELGKVVAHIDTDLSCSDENGIRMVRCREVEIGDLVADAYRIIGEADIGLCNGGGIRADLKAGDIAMRDIIAVNPYGNSLCVVKVTGAEILDMLEYFCRSVETERAKDGRAVGEDGSFQQVSGITFKINTAVQSSVVTDEEEMLVSVGETRRVSDVKVLSDGEYVPIDTEKTYTLASHNYLIKNGGCGMEHMLKDHELVLDEAVSDYQVLIDYISSLSGDLSDYSEVAGRIVIE